jgi:hypothetical protein
MHVYFQFEGILNSFKKIGFHSGWSAQTEELKLLFNAYPMDFFYIKKVHSDKIQGMICAIL